MINTTHASFFTLQKISEELLTEINSLSIQLQNLKILQNFGYVSNSDKQLAQKIGKEMLICERECDVISLIYDVKEKVDQVMKNFNETCGGENL